MIKILPDIILMTIKFENSDSHKILIDEKSHEIILIYDTFHIKL